MEIKKVALIGAGAIEVILSGGLAGWLTYLLLSSRMDSGEKGFVKKDLSSMGSLSAPWYKERKKRAL